MFTKRKHLKGRIIPLVADITSKDDLKRIASQVEQECGYINLLSTHPMQLKVLIP
jgi:hypothetical protein